MKKIKNLLAIALMVSLIFSISSLPASAANAPEYETEKACCYEHVTDIASEEACVNGCTLNLGAIVTYVCDHGSYAYYTTLCSKCGSPGRPIPVGGSCPYCPRPS